MKKILKNKKLLLVLIVILIVGGVTGIVLSRNNKKTSQQKNADVVTFSTDKPDENKPNKDTYKWQGKPTDPKYITMPSISGEGFIQKVGVDQNKEIAVPGNIHVAGWFNQTVVPGEKGLSILDGHVTGRVNNGIFKDLIKMKTGDVFKIEYGNGSSKEFKVVKSVDIEVAKAAGVLFSQEPGIERQVNLITCSGKFDKKTQHYLNRLIVIAQPV